MLKGKLHMKKILLWIPIIWGIFIVSFYGINVVHVDEWYLISLVSNHNVSFGTLWKQFNEHRMIVPFIIQIILGFCSAWNTKIFMYFSVILLGLTYFLISRYYISDNGYSSAFDIVVSVLSGLGIFNTCQHENLLLGFQIAWVIVMAASVGSFFFFSQYYENGKRRDIVLALLLAVLASFSSLHGLIIWVAYFCLAVLLLISKERFPKGGFIAVFITAAITFIMYFTGWHSVSQHYGLRGIGTDNILSFFLGEVGGSLLPGGSSASYILGFILVVSAVILIFSLALHEEVASLFKYIGPMLVGLGSCLACAIGRGSHELASRYYINSLLFVVFFFLLIYFIIKRKWQIYLEENSSLPRKMVSRSFFSILIICECVCMILFVSRNLGGLEECKASKEFRQQIRDIVANYKDVPDEQLGRTYPFPDVNSGAELVRPVCEFLEKNKMSVFADQSTRYYDEEMDFAYNIISGDYRNPISRDNIAVSEGILEVRDGWSYDELNNAACDKVYIKINDHIYHTIPVNREDVAIKFSSNDFIKSGFSFYKNISALDPGMNKITALTICRDGETAIESSPVYFFKEDNEITIYDGVTRYTLSLEDYERTDTAVYNLETATNSFTKGEIDNPLTVSADEIITIEGWAFDSDSQRVYDRIILQFGDWMIELEKKERMDVVDAWNCENYLNSGFYGRFLVGGCEPGSYDADLVMIDTTGGTYFKENGVVTIIIK